MTKKRSPRTPHDAGSNPPVGGRIVLYQTEDGRQRIEVRLEGETVWLTQAGMAELYQTTPQNITLHSKAIHEEGELEEPATCKDYLQVRSEGSRRVQRALKHYNLEVILGQGAGSGPELRVSERPRRVRACSPTRPGQQACIRRLRISRLHSAVFRTSLGDACVAPTRLRRPSSVHRPRVTGHRLLSSVVRPLFSVPSVSLW